ncbi:hypothetical protein CAPTEDRAFT_172031 [Capitella teleta]|uniref:BTB domain-containing protein n=1 Tax=Capitella teleta TaxID=283909 RepID=R7TCP7_CAPTE|nr:hypothetical protein CAPTEDRAFT_172031 [Capitella teleta]|eukprot:ELT91499.1 hypothetical protein CAPTEDRAFT_172031 [Capitella teleta]
MAAKLTIEDGCHSNDVLTRLCTLRRNDQLCDVVLEVMGHNVPAHRSVLACSSKFFMELFAADKDCSQRHFKLDHIDYDSFMVLIDFMYLSRLEVTGDRVRSVYKAARFLKLKKVVSACVNFLTENLTPFNCIGIRSFADKHSDEKFTACVDSFIQKHLSDVLEKSPDAHQLPTIKVDIMGVEAFDLPSIEEKNLCHLVVEWLKGSLNNNLTISDLADNPSALYLTGNNDLQDCLDLEFEKEEDDVVRRGIVEDYKKMHQKQNKRKLMIKDPSEVALDVPLSVCTTSPPTWEVLASKMVQEHKCVCVAALHSSLIIITMKLHPRPSSPASTNGNESDTSAFNGHSPSLSPRLSTDKGCCLIPLAQMNNARCGLGVARLNDKLVAMGGYDRGECVDSVEVFDVSTNSWSELPKLLTARGRFDATQIDDCLYACGGSNGASELNSAECFNSTLNKWLALPDMASNRSNAGVVALNGKVYAVGGWNGSSLASCEVYDPDTDAWTSIASLKYGRSQAAVCAYGGCIYAVGGCDAWKCLASAERYNPETDEWTSIASAGTPRRGAGVQVFNDKLYVVGGNDGQSCLSSVEIFDPVSHSWSFGPTLNVARANVGVSVIQDRLFAVGGFSGKLFLNSIEYLPIDGKQWCVYVPNENKKLVAATSVHSLNGDFDDEALKSENGCHSECTVAALNGVEVE